MVIMYLLLFIIVAFGVRFGRNDDYIIKDSTTSIKGLFVIIVFFSHFSNYVKLEPNIFNSLFVSINHGIGQLMVVMFFFYSGYGISHKIVSANGEQYIKHFLQNRFFPTWIQFAICVTLYLIMDIATGLIENYSIKQIFLSYIGWESIGNSNWFMFVTFALYLFVFVSFIFIRGNKHIYIGLLCISALSVALIIALFFVKESCWWNTLLCFPLGMWYRWFQFRIDKYLARIKHYFSTLLFLAVLFCVIWLMIRKNGNDLWFIGLSLVFAIFVVMITMRISIGNKVLRFFGSHVFSIYILQRLPMIVLQNRIGNVYLYFIICLGATVLIAWLFDSIYSTFKKKSAIKRFMN